MSGVGLATFGYLGDAGVAGGPLGAPTLSNFTPDMDLQPGEPGAFSANYSVARFTPVEFDITDIVAGAGITISIKFDHRDETYTILSHDGVWLWPFDTESSMGGLAAEPVHVVLLPRDGWPPVPWEIKVAAVKPAVEV